MFLVGVAKMAIFIVVHADQQRDHKYKNNVSMVEEGWQVVKIRLLITLLHIKCGASSKRALDKNWIFSEINEESIGGPLPDALDLVQWGPSKSKCGCTTHMKGVAGNFIGWRYFANPVNEPGTSRDITIGMEPEMGKMLQEVVMLGKIDLKEL